MSRAYESLIQRFRSQDPKERPSFDEIVNKLENNEGFITDIVDKNEYLDYVNSLNEYSTTFDPSKRIELTQLFLQKSLRKSQRDDGNRQKDQHQLHQFCINRAKKESQDKSVHAFKMAADKRSINAVYNYGYMLSKGEGVSMNKEEACRYYKMAENLSEIDSSFCYIQ